MPLGLYTLNHLAIVKMTPLVFADTLPYAFPTLVGSFTFCIAALLLALYKRIRDKRESCVVDVEQV